VVLRGDAALFGGGCDIPPRALYSSSFFCSQHFFLPVAFVIVIVVVMNKMQIRL
jgi:hypothetical protein